MTEDDTFRVLSRPLIAEMSILLDDFCNNRGGVVSVERENIFLERHGWSREEFYEEILHD